MTWLETGLLARLLREVDAEHAAAERVTGLEILRDDLTRALACVEVELDTRHE